MGFYRMKAKPGIPRCRPRRIPAITKEDLDEAVRLILSDQRRLKRYLKMKQAELVEHLKALATQNTKSKGEVLAAIQKLKDALGDVDLSPEVGAALTELDATVQAIDDIDPDDTTTPSLVTLSPKRAAAHEAAKEHAAALKDDPDYVQHAAEKSEKDLQAEKKEQKKDKPGYAGPAR